MQVWDGAWGLFSYSTDVAYLGAQYSAWRNKGDHGTGRGFPGCGPAFGAHGGGIQYPGWRVGAIRKIWGRISSVIEELRRNGEAGAQWREGIVGSDRRCLPNIESKIRRCGSRSRACRARPAVERCHQLSRRAPDGSVRRSLAAVDGQAASRAQPRRRPVAVALADVADGWRIGLPLLLPPHCHVVPARSSASACPIFTGATGEHHLRRQLRRRVLLKHCCPPHRACPLQANTVPPGNVPARRHSRLLFASCHA